MGTEEPEFEPEDAIAREKRLDSSSPSRPLDDEDDEEDEDEEARVLIKDKKSLRTEENLYQEQPARKWSPRMSAFLFSKYISYFWCTNLLVKGSKKPLEEDDLEGINPDDCLHPLTEAMERNWYNEAYDEDGKMKTNPSLGKALVKTFGMQFFIIGFFPLCNEILRMIQPIFMGWLIEYFQGEGTKSSAFGYAFIMVLCFLCQSWTIIPFNYMRSKYGVHARVAITGLVYKKVMKLSLKALGRSTTGFIVNLVSNDASKLERAAFFLHYLWIGPIELIIVTYLLIRELGPSALAGIAALCLLTPIQMMMGRLIMYFRKKINKYTDIRVKIMNEIIAGMKVIKLYTWEDSFTEWIEDLRRNEVNSIRHLSWARAAIMSFFFSATALVSFITFTTYVMTGNSLTPQKVFTSLALFNVARMMFTLYFPIGITFFNEGRVAIERIQEKMLPASKSVFKVRKLTLEQRSYSVVLMLACRLADELSKIRKSRILVEEDMDPEAVGSTTLRPKSDACSIKAENISASWTENHSTLEDLSFEVKSGELLAIIGPVGSGKSSVLMSLLGELPLNKGNLDVKGKAVYASQEPWVFNGTVRYNITFGHQFDEERYNEVIKACALERDLELLAHGDQTLVGERGVSLSGGQKARVNLARAVYADADIYIMDDPLSAVDANVGRHLYDKCINGFLADKVRILVTHQIQYLTDADTIVALAHGKCIGKGTFNELSEMGIDFMNLVLAEDDELPLDLTDGSGEGEEEQNRFELAKRRFSKQLSCVDGELDLPGQVVRKRAVSFQQQMTTSSYRSAQCYNFNESSVTISNDVAEVVTYEEEKMDSVVPKEVKFGGSIGSDIYINFFNSGYGKWAWVLIMFFFGVSQAIYILADWWLSEWSTKEAMSNSFGKVYEDRDTALGVYAVLVILLVCLGLGKAFLFFQVMLQSTQAIHMVMFNAIMRAPMYFFDTNSIGRILNRFSKDTSLVDDFFAFTFFDLLQTGLIVLGVFILVSMKMPLVLALVLPILIAFIMLRVYYIKTARELKRIEGVARSPVFGHFSTTLLGLPTIRAFRVQDTFFDILGESQDIHTEAYMSFLGVGGWLSFNLDLLCGMFIAFVCFVVVIFEGQFDAGVVGLMLAYAISIPGTFQQFVRQSTELENQFTSVERILEYGELESEGPGRTDVVPDKEWPQRGSIVFDRLNFTYHKSLPDVLHCINAHIKSGEKIGVCGRTGAGKSSLLSTLFRTSEPGGLITVDGQDITKIGLKDLRTKISIIPQEPVLFSGTMRKNLDPFGEHSDMDLWQVLEEVQLKEAISELPSGLESEMAESGGNLSVGQRQLICLARAILKRNKILVIDEATANVDPKKKELHKTLTSKIRTDALIQTTIREKFLQCTVLTIAHRLHTIMDSDRIMVLDAGNLKEFNEPYTLLRCRNSILYDLVAQTGHAEAQSLFEIAMTKHNERQRNQSKKSEEVKELSLPQMGDCGENCPCCKPQVQQVQIVVEDTTTTAQDEPVNKNIEKEEKPEVEQETQEDESDQSDKPESDVKSTEPESVKEEEEEAEVEVEKTSDDNDDIKKQVQRDDAQDNGDKPSETTTEDNEDKPPETTAESDGDKPSETTAESDGDIPSETTEEKNE